MKIIQFLYKDNIIAQQPATLWLNEIDEIKWLLAESYKCFPDDIEIRVAYFETKKDLSTLDCDNKGIFIFNGNYPTYVNGVMMTINESSDEFLDVIQGKNIDNFIEKYLHFSF